MIVGINPEDKASLVARTCGLCPQNEHRRRDITADRGCTIVKKLEEMDSELFREG